MNSKMATPPSPTKLDSVLILEPDNLQRKGIAIALVDYFNEIQLTETPGEALALLDKYTFDVIISDIHFPLNNGLQVIQKFKEKCPTANIIITSSYYNLESEEALNKIGITRFHPKPVQLKYLKYDLENLTQRKINL